MPEGSILWNAFASFACMSHPTQPKGLTSHTDRGNLRVAQSGQKLEPEVVQIQAKQTNKRTKARAGMTKQHLRRRCLIRKSPRSRSISGVSGVLYF